MTQAKHTFDTYAPPEIEFVRGEGAACLIVKTAIILIVLPVLPSMRWVMPIRIWLKH